MVVKWETAAKVWPARVGINKYVNPSKGCLAPSQPQAGIGIGIGDVPEEMKKEIWDLEYGELLPETWRLFARTKPNVKVVIS